MLVLILGFVLLGVSSCCFCGGLWPQLTQIVRRTGIWSHFCESL